MPRAEENLLPRGDPRGQTTARQEFVSSTRPQRQAGAPNAATVDEQPIPIGVEPEFEEALFSPTARPQEPVTTQPVPTPERPRSAAPSPEVLNLLRDDRIGGELRQVIRLSVLLSAAEPPQTPL